MKNKLLAILIILSFIQCRKDDPISFCEQYPDQCVEMERIKDHYYFKKDSWWVYEEQNSGTIDSQWVEKSWLNSNNKEFDMVIRSSRHDYDLHRWTHLLTPAKNNDVVEKRKVAYIERSKTKAGDFVGTSYIGIFYPEINVEVSNPNINFKNNKLTIQDVYSEYKQNGNKYLQVVSYFENSDKTESNQSVKTYYAKGVGLIKKELIDSNEVWGLKKYEVRQ